MAIVPYPIDDLFEIARAEDVQVVWYPDPFCPRGKYLVVEGRAIILLSPMLKRCSMRLRCTLAHELGHHFTGLSGRRDESRANKWARELVLPEIWMRHRLHWEPWELAEAAGVYQFWVEDRVRELVAKSGPALRPAYGV